MISNLVKGGNFDRLNEIFITFNFFDDVVDRNFLIFEGEGNDQLENSKSNWFLFVLGFPEKAILGDFFE